MQILIEKELSKRAAERASQLGVSLAEYFRRLLRRDLGEPVRARDPSAVFNLGNSGGSDVAREKDRMVGEALGAVRPLGEAKK
jgi:hypothetical protein